jgi:hypothetical protein
MSNDVSLKLLLLGEDRSASKAVRGVGTAVDETAAKTKTMGGVMKGALSAAVVAQAAQAVYDFGKDSIEAYRGAAASQRQLDDAYKRFPSIADVSIKKLREQAAAIEAKTGADADDIAGGQAVLARYKLTGKQISAMTPLLVDYAKRTGKEIPAASGTLGKAIMGNAKAMKELGIKFKDTGDPAKNYELIMAGLKDKVGGFAASEATTLDGKLSILQTKFGNLQESVGEKLVPVILTLADGAQKLVGWIEQNASWLGPLAAGIGITTAAFAALNLVMSLNPFGIIVVAIGALVGGLIWAYQNVEWFRNGVEATFKFIGDIARWLWNNALAPAIRGIVRGFAWVVDGLAGLLEGLGNIPGFEWAKDAAKGLRGMAQGARDAADGIKDIPDAKPEIKVNDQVTAPIRAIDKRIKSVKDKIVKAKAEGDTREVDRLQAKLKALKDKRVKITTEIALGNRTTVALKVTNRGTVKLGLLAKGGRARKGQPYIVGEERPELFVPDEDGYVQPRVPASILNDRRSSVMVSSGRQAAAVTGNQTVIQQDVRIVVQGDSDPLGAAKKIEQHLVKLRSSRAGRKLAFV